ncbi:Glycosyl transferase family 2 [Palleronia salina]|uniref:Glycosyl transferase family 2 n=2 Tax=Palleronia TaxID=315422 RepID=A0A1M6CNH2_9RHOB|nr:MULTISPECIES: glycosyltransferase family 2 protein [Palleronia]SEN22898.1 Glycosyl transferase family 2 [Palleronia pelagia]SHI62582.1 Glycosyl transferase family 2 [Palleronia salina]
MSILDAYKRGARRRRLYLRAIRKRRELECVRDRTQAIKTRDILVVTVLRDEIKRLPFFLKYYRDLGIRHFLMVDNGSTDGSCEYLAEQPDVSLWSTGASYRRARFGVDWVNWLARRYGLGKWILTVDVDEFFIYPFCDTRPIRALTDWLDAAEIRSFGAMMLDMYPKGAMTDVVYQPGQDPLEICSWFDAGNYMISRNWDYASLWIQGGPRARKFFAETPYRAPALNKVPLVKWGRGNVFVSSTHMLLPRGLNLVFDDRGGEKACGCLLHVKFLDAFLEKSQAEVARAEHYRGAAEYRAYADALRDDPDLWCKWSEKYINWRQLEILGLMSKGNWA